MAQCKFVEKQKSRIYKNKSNIITNSSQADMFVGKDSNGVDFFVNDILELHYENDEQIKHGIVYYYEEQRAYCIQLCWIDDKGSLNKSLVFEDFGLHLKAQYLFSNVYETEILWNWI